MRTYAYGFPRLGRHREYKKAIEEYWKGQRSRESLEKGLDALQSEMVSAYRRNVDAFPVGEMTGYDQMLDTAIMIGRYAPRDLEGYYDLCRGRNALEMTKWFNTNYHYLVPDFSGTEPASLRLHWNKPKEYLERFGTGLPYLLGPFTFLKLSKGVEGGRFFEFLSALGSIYRTVLSGFARVHIDEPAFVLETSPPEVDSIVRLYDDLALSGCEIGLFTYYDSVDFLSALCETKISALGLDFVHGRENMGHIEKHGFPDDKTLVAGLIDGRNVWRADIAAVIARLTHLSKFAKHLTLSNGAPLSHVPVTLEGEKLEARLMRRLSFAEEKLEELRLTARVFEGRETLPGSPAAELHRNTEIEERVSQLTDEDFIRKVPHKERRTIQARSLDLPILPTTTIGSFPQTSDVRRERARFKNGEISPDEYESFIREKIRETIRRQEELGLDVLVHGEFERSDMVEFFAEQLDGIAATGNGWIISYGTRGYRPPIIFGDISRPHAMTVKESSYAQSLTSRPVKGMLTGPVTIIAWSFVREDIPIEEVAYQISLALRDEIADLENAGISIIQVDEPAFREAAPNKKRDWNRYFEWATRAFRLATGGALPRTQVHSHMCYSEFGEIIDRIADMDFDVISIEATRSRGDVLKSFEGSNFDRKIGLGVWDIHSPAVPGEEDIEAIIRRALKVIPKENFWINPDCGLKTRKWEETLASLKNLVRTARRVREMEA